MRTDAELFQDCLRTGDRAALDHLFSRHYPAVYHVVLKLLRNSADASDLTQATFLKALEAARAGRPPEALRPWLLTIAVNAVRQWKRGDRRRSREDWLFESCRRELPERAPDREAERREFEQALDEAFEQFPDELAEPLVLHYYQGLSYAEVGRILGLSKTTVQFRMERALEKLRARFNARGLRSLASLIPELFPSARSSRLIALGVAVMNAKKIAVALLIVLSLAAVGRRVWIARAAAPGSARADAGAFSSAASARGKSPDTAGEAAQAPGLFGTVFDQRSLAPVPGALVSAYDLENARTLDTVSDEKGRYRVPCGDACGTWHVKISREGYAPATLRAARCSAEPRNAFLSQGGTIKGRVVDADGLPAGAARILAVRRLYSSNDFDLTQALYQQILPREGIVDGSTSARASDGTFELSHLPPGLYVLSVVAPGAAPDEFPEDTRYKGDSWGIDVAEDSSHDVVIHLPRQGTLRVRVSDRSTHEPIAGALVTGLSKIDRTRLPLEEFSFKTDAAGECALPAPRHNQGTLDSMNFRVSHEGYGTQCSGIFGHDDGYVLEIQLGKTGRIQGHVQGSDGKPLVSGAVYVVGDTDGGVVDQAFTDAEGFYRTRELNAPQVFEVHVFDPGLSRPRTLTPILLREGETRTLDFGTSSRTGISGTVRRRSAPCARALICVDALEGDKHRSVFYADDQGAFAIEGLTPGPYELFVNAETQADGALYFKRRLTLADGDHRDFRFEAGARAIRGTVIDAATLAPPGKDDMVDVVARLSGSTDPIPPITTRTRPDGTFELLLDAAGLYHVEIADDHWTFHSGDRLDVDLNRDTMVENLRLLVHRDTQDRKIRLRLKDRDDGVPITEGWYQMQFRGGSGAGTMLGDVIEQTDARIGPWTFKVLADEYVPERFSLNLRPEDQDVERTLQLRKSDAVKVTTVKPSSPAERAGLRPGDLLLSCNGSRSRNLKALESICQSLPATQSVTLSVRRGTTTLDVVVSEPKLGIDAENALSD